MKLEATKIYKAVKTNDSHFTVTVTRRNRVIGEFSINILEDKMSVTIMSSSKHIGPMEIRTAGLTVMRKLNNDKLRIEEAEMFEKKRAVQKARINAKHAGKL